MKCPYCSEEINDDAVFCGACGMRIQNPAVQTAAAPEPEPETVSEPETEVSAETAAEPAVDNVPAEDGVSAEKPAADFASQAKAVGSEALSKANEAADSAAAAVSKVIPGVNKTVLIIACAGVLALIILAIVLISVFAGNSGNTAYRKIDAYVGVFDKEGSAAFFVDGKQFNTSIDYSKYSYYVYADKASALIYNSGIYSVGEKISKIDSDVSYYYISPGNKAVAYISDGKLMLYRDGAKKKIHEYKEDSSFYSVNAAVSPSGNYVLYTETDSDGKSNCYVWNGTESKKLAKNLTPLCVSDDGKIAYVSDSKGDIKCLKNLSTDDSVKVGSGFFSIRAVSPDCKKILAELSKGTYYYDPSLENAIKLSSSAVYMIVPDRCSSYVIDNFNSFVGMSDGKAVRFTRKGTDYEKFTIANGNAYTLSADGNSMLYLRNNKLNKISTVSDKADPVTLASDVYSYAASSDFSKIYARTNDKELIFTDGKSKDSNQRITDDTDYYEVTENGMCVYLDDSGTLRYTSSGAKGEKAEKMNDCQALISDGKYFYAWKDDTLFFSKDGKTFESTKIER